MVIKTLYKTKISMQVYIQNYNYFKLAYIVSLSKIIYDNLETLHTVKLVYQKIKNIVKNLKTII